MSNKGVQRYLEGTAHNPPAIPEYPDGHILLTDEVDELEKIEEKWDIYNQREASIKAKCSPRFLRLLPSKSKSWKPVKRYGIPCVKNMRKGHLQSLWTSGKDIYTQMFGQFECKDPHSIPECYVPTTEGGG